MCKAYLSCVARSLVVLGVGLLTVGCNEPEHLLPAVPPGINAKTFIEPPKEADEPQALGEQAAVTSKTAPKPAIAADLVPAEPTTIGESKTTPGGVRYGTLREGTGAVAKAGQRVTVHYKGTLEDGRKFDSSYDRKAPADFEIGTGAVIKGWDEAVPGMRIGERRTLVVPPNMGYGALGQGSRVPPNATLIFEIELIDVH